MLQPKVGNQLRGIGRGCPARQYSGKTKGQPQQQSLSRQNGDPRTGHTFSPALFPIGIGGKI
jgi:hypothetical protein